MDTIDRSRYENNSLKEEIEKLLEFRSKETNKNIYVFEDPIEEEEMTAWEQKTGITIPESYKEWLRFSRESTLDVTVGVFWGPDKFDTLYASDDLIVIGTIIGDGELVCFSKKDGHFVGYFEGRIDLECDDFKEVLNELIDVIVDSNDY